MLRPRTLLGAALAVLCLVGPFQIAQAANPADNVMAGQYTLDHDHSRLLWSVRHLGLSDFYGQFTDFDASLKIDPARPADSRLDVTIRTASVATNNPKLDGHLASKDFFNVSAFPEGRFTSTSVTPTGPDKALVKGELTLLGVTRPVELTVTLIGAGPHPFTKKQMAGFSASGSLKRSDFGMNFMLPGIGDTVTLTISGEFARE